MTDTQKKYEALKAVADAIIDTVRAAGPQGVPAGHMYAVFMNIGWSLEQFEQIMSGLVLAGKLRKDGLIYRLAGAR